MKTIMFSLLSIILTCLLISCASTKGGFVGQKFRNIKIERVGVMEFKGPYELAVQFTDAFTIELFKIGKFDVYERDQIDKILQEQDFSISGRTEENIRKSLGKLANLDALFLGVIDSYQSPRDMYSTDYNLNLRLVDIETGAIIYAISAKSDWTLVSIFGTRRNMMGKIVTSIAQDIAKNFQDLPQRAKQVVTPASVAVLPFVNMSGDPENEYFSDGITEQLINALSKVEGLHVASRTSAFAFKGKQVDIHAIGQQLDVGNVLEGTVQKVGTRVRISVQLISVADGNHLWSESYRREVEDIFAIQDEISRTIVTTLKVKLVGEPNRPFVKRSTDDLEAYNLYLKGRFYWNKWTEEGLKKSIEYFQQSIEKDPGYALPHAGLADSYNVLGGYTFLQPKASFPWAEAAASKALELDGNLAEAHASLAVVRFLYDWDWLEAEREFKRAIELNPGYASAHHAYAVYLTAMGRFDKAIEEIRRSQELDPLSLPINSFVGWVYYYARQYDQAIELEKETLVMEPNFPAAHFSLGSTYLQNSKFDKAIAEFQKAITLSGGTAEEMALLGVAFAASGRRGETLNVLDQLKERSKREYVPWIRFAMIEAALGRSDQAFASLQQAYEERSGELVFLKIDPVWDNLRADPRFAALLRKVGLE